MDPGVTFLFRERRYGSDVSQPPVILIHGAATTASVWERVVPLLDGLEVRAVERPCSGDLATELRFLAPLVEGAIVVGVGGGATLGLALASSEVRFVSALLHEPAVGSLAPELLAPMAAAFADGGVEAFGARLYGPSWNRSLAPLDDAVVARELGMFRGFEPQAAAAGRGAVLVTTGANSPTVRHEAASSLSAHLGYETSVLEGCAHFVHWDNPDVLASSILAAAARG